MAKPRLHGRAFYESIGSPKMIVAPMVDRSEYAWRLLTRSYLDEERSKSLLAYTPMLHARLFKDGRRFRDDHFQPVRESLVSKEMADATPWLDGNPKNDRPLFVQFCANQPDDLLEAARYVAPYCDAVDLNLGCPQGIAKSGHYGAFLQEHWDTIYALINKLHKELSIPITAKMRVLDTREKTLEYAKMILSAGASILTVHGRRREQKAHNMGVADWGMIRYLRDNLPPETVLFANGNILNSGDLERCLEATGVDGIMSAEGNLSDPTIFALPPSDPHDREFWRGPDGQSGYRIDGVFRRYLDIIHQHILEEAPPQRQPLYVPGDPTIASQHQPSSDQNSVSEHKEKSTKRKRNATARQSPSLRVMQGHLFQLLRPMVTNHTDIRDALAKTRVGDIDAFERVLSMVEEVTKKGLDEEAAATKDRNVDGEDESSISSSVSENEADMTPSQRTIAKYKRPWWVCQPYLRPSPEDALKIGSIQLSKKEKARLAMEDMKEKTETGAESQVNDVIQRTDAAEPLLERKVNDPVSDVTESDDGRRKRRSTDMSNELPREALVCG